MYVQVYNQHMICVQWMTYQGFNFGLQGGIPISLPIIYHMSKIGYIMFVIFFTFPHCNMHFSYYTQMKQIHVHYQGFCKFLFMINKHTTFQVL